MRSKVKSEELAAPLYVRPDDKMSIKHIDKEKAYKKKFTILDQHHLFLKALSQLK